MDLKNERFSTVRSSFNRKPAKMVIREKIEERCRDLFLLDDTLHEVMNAMNENMKEGLSNRRSNSAAMKMLPSYCYSTDSISKDANRLNILFVDTDGKHTIIGRLCPLGILDRKYMSVKTPRTVLNGTGEEFFDHIAECISKYSVQYGYQTLRNYAIFFIFPFPCLLEGRQRATLIEWTKEFNIHGVVARDVVQMLREACEKKELEIGLIEYFNDTMESFLPEMNCQMSVVVGAGTNASYTENLNNIPKLLDTLDGQQQKNPSLKTIISTEWGAFGGKGELDFIRTRFDHQVDLISINPGKQIFEKMVSGTYLGELARLVLKELTNDQLLFNGDLGKLTEQGSFPTKYIVEIERELADHGDGKYDKIYEILDELEIQNFDTNDCNNMRYICSLLSTRSAFLVAAGTGVLINKMNYPYTRIATSGSMYCLHPNFAKLYYEKIGQLIDINYEYELKASPRDWFP